MFQYLELLKKVNDYGEIKGSRATLASTGEKPRTKSIFGYQMRFNLADGFPIVTTKFIPFRQIAVELLWFLSGSTNVKPLQKENVHIWDQWASPDGELGPVYGYTWRHWTGINGTHVDQVAKLLEGIERVKQDPTASASRRLIITSWDPAALPYLTAPSGCHTLCQFYVNNGKLSCQLYQRSADLFLGVPWNISSYALFTHILAKATGLVAHEFIHTFGDAHIYENHGPQVQEQLLRSPFMLPELVIDGSVSDLDNLDPDQFRLEGYTYHPRLRGEVAI